MKTAIILRGASGSGKTTLATWLQGLNFNKDIRICCADDFFMKGGRYDFNPALLGAANQQCQQEFEQALADGNDVIISNTSTTNREKNWYISRAKAAGYRVFSLVVENLGTENVHNVPPEVLERQKNNLKQSIDL